MQRFPDPLGVRAASRFVMNRARHVTIDLEQATRVAREIIDSPALPDVMNWETDHLGSRTLTDDELANFVLVLDALNFYFWGCPRWRITYQERTENGYWALTLALRRALLAGYPITDAHYLATIPAADVAHILRGESVIPEFAARVHNLREAGEALLRDYDGRFLTAISEAGNSGASLLRRVITSFPSFVDVRAYNGRAIPFYKRAQILVSDLGAAFESRGVRLFDDLSCLTAFADYKVPQVLQHLGVLKYSAELERTLSQGRIVPAGSAFEVEIRAATIVAVDNITLSTFELGSPQRAYEIDWHLWALGQKGRSDRLTYHRTPTIAY